MACKSEVFKATESTPGLWVQTHNPKDGSTRYKDGSTRYRFANKPTRGYFMDCDSEIYYTSGAKNAMIFIAGFRKGSGL